MTTRLGILAGAALMALTAITAVSPPAHATAATRSARPLDCYAVYPMFYNRWYWEDPGYGCATTPLLTASHYVYQLFENGEIMSDPAKGPNMVISVRKYQYASASGWRWAIKYSWGQTPGTYDDWLIRTYLNSQYTGQRDCGTNSGSSCYRTGGSDVWAPVGNGYWDFIVEGCHTGVNGHICDGWTDDIAISIP